MLAKLESAVRDARAPSPRCSRGPRARRARSRHRRPRGPADPALAVRLGRRRRARRLVRRAGGPVAEAAAGEREEREVLRVPQVVEVLCGAVGIALFGLVVWAGLAGAQSADREPRADVRLRRLLELHPGPQPAVRRRVPRVQPVAGARPRRGWVAQRVAPAACPRRCRTPSGSAAGRRSLGTSRSRGSSSPTRTREDPSWLAILALVYAAVQLVGMALYGVEAWTRRGDGFGVYFRLFGGLSPLHWRDRRLSCARRCRR